MLQGYADIVTRLVLKRNARVNMVDRFGWTALHWAVRVMMAYVFISVHIPQVATGDLGCVNALISSKRMAIIASNYKGETALHLAAREGNLEARC